VAPTESTEGVQPVTRIKEIPESECSLASVGELRAEVLENRHRGMCTLTPLGSTTSYPTL
jgi:hypothetical protein